MRTLTIASCKTLNETITGLRNAPKILTDARRELDTIQRLTKSLIGALNGVHNSALSQTQQDCFTDLRLVVSNCTTTCEGFTSRLSSVTSTSRPDHISPLDRLRLHLNENDVSILRSALERDKQTLDVALGMATLTTLRKNGDAFQLLENRVADAVNEFTGQIEGLRLATHHMSASNSIIRSEDVDLVVKTLNQHNTMLTQCLRVCQSGLKETSARTGMTVKHAVALDKASVFVGGMGVDGNNSPQTPAVVLDLLEARNEAKATGGKMSAEVAKAFWGAK